MGGTKRKIPIEKIEKKESRSVAFTKRREGLYRKATELCLLCNAHIAILATPPSAKSNASFYSFGHSSVDEVLDAFLQNRSPTMAHDHTFSCSRALKKKGCLVSEKPFSGLGFFWEEEGFESTESTEDLRNAIDDISKLMNNVKFRLNDFKNQRPRFAEKLEEFSVQGLQNNDRNNDTLEAVVGNLAPQDSNKTQKISENFDRLMKLGDQDSPTTTTNNSVSRFEDCRDEEAQKIEASSVSDKDLEDSLGDGNFDYLFTDFYTDSPQSLEEL